jgi:hypothetical protein
MKCVNHKAVVIIGMLLVSPMAMSDSCGAVLCMAESGSIFQNSGLEMGN